MAVPTNSPVISTISIKAPLAEFVYGNVFLNTIENYSDKFGDKYVSSRSSGETVFIPKPTRSLAEGGRGVSSTDFNATPIVEEKIAITVDSYRGIHKEVTVVDQALEFNDDFNGQILNPYTKNLTNFCESDGLEEVSNLSEVIIGTGTGGGISFDDGMDCLSILKENAIDDKPIICLAPQRIHSSMVKDQSAVFNPASEISSQKFKGLVGDYAGMGWAVSENIPNHVTGTAADGSFVAATGLRPLGTVTLTAVNGVSTLAIEGIGTDGTINKGDVIYIAGTNAVNAITRADLGRKKGFNVAATETSSTNAVTLTLTEYFADASGVNKDDSLQNVSVLPTTGAIVYIAGEVSSTYKQAPVYCKETFGCAMINLTKPENTGVFYAQEEVDGIKVRVIKDYTNGTDSNAYRIDNFSGYFTLRPEWGVRMWQKIS